MAVLKDSTQRRSVADEPRRNAQHARVRQRSHTMGCLVRVIEELGDAADLIGLLFNLGILSAVRLGLSTLLRRCCRLGFRKGVSVQREQSILDVPIEALDEFPAERVDGGDYGQAILPQPAANHCRGVLRVRDNSDRLTSATQALSKLAAGLMLNHSRDSAEYFHQGASLS